MTPRVVVVGSMHMDFVVVLNRFPEIGETVIGKDFKMTPGGKGANQAVSAARLGAETYLVSRVGNDSIGVHLLENLRSNSVRDRYVTIDTESYTGVALIFVDSKGRNMIAVAPGTDARVSREDVERKVLNDERIKKFITSVKKTIYIQDKLINIVVEGKK